VPKDISGVYLRNGPNPKFIPSNGRQHWFDGDSMIHAIRIKNGELQYSNKYTMTDKLKEEVKRNKPVVLRVSELQSGFSGLIKMGIHELYKSIGYHPEFETFKDGNANTAFVTHANKTYALAESQFPFEIKIDKDHK
jgi:carotenoid cleavage dioxygenase-like enzyme